MNRLFVVGTLVVAAGLFAGCTATGRFDGVNDTQAVLARKNFRIVKANIEGTSTGLTLLGVIPVDPPTRAKAVALLWARSGLQPIGGAYALTNLAVDESNGYFVLFSLPAVTVRADIVEFTE
jgi:hypothetical protein